MDSRRDFLKGTAWLGATAVAAGCMGGKLRIGRAGGAPMANFRAPSPSDSGRAVARPSAAWRCSRDAG